MNEQVVPSLLATLVERLVSQEGLDLEFKAAKGGLPNSIWETVGSFANTRGGWIILGVAERDGRSIVEGVSNAAALQRDFYNLLRNPNKISHPVCGGGDVSIEMVGESEVLVLRVPAAPRKARPVYINGNPYTGTFVRRQDGDYRCSKPEVDRMMREASDEAADSTVLTGYGWGDLDRDSLARYRRRFQTRDPGSPWNAYDDERFLRAVGGYRRDRDTGREGITVAALLMFGTLEALRDWRSRHLIDFRLILSEPSLEGRWDDRILWEGNLLGAFEAIYPRLVAELPVPFQLQGATRVDESPVHVAFREAFINLLAHADYGEAEVSLVIRSQEGCRFRNPGNSRVSEEDLLTADRSDARNPVLLQMFRLIGLAEEAGTGMPKILASWRALGFQLPEIDVGTERYEFGLNLRYVHLLSEEDREWLASLGENWSEPEQLALIHARHGGDVDNLRLRRLSGQHPADATKTLGGLRGRGFLEMVGGKRGARYVLGPAAALAPLSVGGVAAGGATGGGAGAQPPEVAGESPEIAGKSPEVPSKPLELAPISGDLWQELERIAAVARERPYLDAATRDALVLRLCAVAPLSLRELAGLLGRTLDHTRAIVSGLLSSRRLAYLYPDQPRHPRQRYLTPTSDTNRDTESQRAAGT